MNHSRWWYKYVFIVIVPLIAGFYALPNIFGNDPGIQIRALKGDLISEKMLQHLEGLLKKHAISFKSLVMDKKKINIRFENKTNQIQAKQVLDNNLDKTFLISLTLFSGVPQWMHHAGANPMYLGLDLRGGIHLLLEVDMNIAIKQAVDSYISDIKNLLREKNIRYISIEEHEKTSIKVILRNSEKRNEGYRIIQDEFPNFNIDKTIELDQSECLLVMLRKTQIEEIKKLSVEQNMITLRNRIDQLGIVEPVIQQQGSNRIIIQLPGLQDPDRAKRILGRAATLEMHLVDEKRTISAVQSGLSPPGSRLYKFKNGESILLKNQIIYSGDNMIDASVSFHTQTRLPIVSITLDSVGARINQRVTKENIGNRIAVVYLETTHVSKTDRNGNIVLNDQGDPVRVTKRIEEVLTAPVVMDQLGKRYQIEGIDTIEKASDLALMLRSGRLSAPLEIIEERTIGPSLGEMNIRQGLLAVIMSFILILFFMIIYYRLFGIIASIALTINLVLMVAVLSLLQATLTLPGVAGIVLTVGITVDSNVLIFERIREEIRQGKTIYSSIQLGYDKAWSAIFDANVTTLISSIALFIFGTGPIKGFAVTLIIGLLTSMFTTIQFTRTLVNWIVSGKLIKKIQI